MLWNSEEEALFPEYCITLIESNTTRIVKQVVIQDGGCCCGSRSPESGLYVHVLCRPIMPASV